MRFKVRDSKMRVKVNDATMRTVQGDITDQEVDAVVNAANSSLMGGGGVDGAIHRKGGTSILVECKKIRSTQYPQGLPTGKAVITTAGNLKARYVIHTVGPIWRGGGDDEPALLEDAYKNSLRLAVDKGLQTVAFPSISTGAYGYPIKDASRIAIKTIKDFLEKQGELKEVRLVLFSRESYEAFDEALKEVFPTPE